MLMTTTSSSSELFEIKDQFEVLQKKYKQYLPNVDPALIADLLLRQMENPRSAPMYMVEMFTKPGVDREKVRQTIIDKTGQVPAVYDNGTHYATHHRLTLELLKEISDIEGAIEITGGHDSGNWAASHEHGTHEKWYDPPELSFEPNANLTSESPRQEEKKNDYRIAAFVAAGIVGAIALAGFIVSGGILPNANVGQAIPPGTEPGLVHGRITGPGGLPAVGATVLAAQQGADFSTSAFVSVNGQYSLDLPSGKYIVYVAYPDGTDKTATVNIQRGGDQELNFAY